MTYQESGVGYAPMDPLEPVWPSWVRRGGPATLVTLATALVVGAVWATYLLLFVLGHTVTPTPVTAHVSPNNEWLDTGVKVTTGDKVQIAAERAYEVAERIRFDGMQFRKDIGHHAFGRR